MIPLGTYKHFKGDLYEVLGIGVCTETGQEYVIYNTLKQNTPSTLWLRPLKMFQEAVEVDGKVVPRFTLIEK